MKNEESEPHTDLSTVSHVARPLYGNLSYFEIFLDPLSKKYIKDYWMIKITKERRVEK